MQAQPMYRVRTSKILIAAVIFFLLAAILIAILVPIFMHRTRTLAEANKILMDGWNDEEKFPPIELTQEEKDALSGLSSPGNPEDGQAAPAAQTTAATPCTRKEVRALTAQERNDYFAGVKQCHDTKIPGSTKTYYQVLAEMHRKSMSPSAHMGPSFICWHEEYLLRFENCVRKFIGTACLPYIDWTKDRDLSSLGVSSCDSVLFSDDYYGQSSGSVTTGVTANWQVTSDCYVNGPTLYRECTSSKTSYLYTQSSLNTYQAYTAYEKFTNPRSTKFEDDHGGPHMYVGGQMGYLSCAPHDAVFWSHHAFIDCIFQWWRGTHTTTLSSYPSGTDIKDPYLAQTIAKPFGDTSPPTYNRDCLGSKYKGFYTCVKPPSTCTTDANCGMGMWCKSGKCYSKIKVGAKCGANPSNICYQEAKCKTAVKCQTTCRC